MQIGVTLIQFKKFRSTIFLSFLLYPRLNVILLEGKEKKEKGNFAELNASDR